MYSTLLDSQTLLVLFNLTLKTLVLAVMAAVVLQVLRIRDVSLSHTTWTSVLWGMLLLAPWSLVAPGTPIQLPSFENRVSAEAPRVDTATPTVLKHPDAATRPTDAVEIARFITPEEAVNSSPMNAEHKQSGPVADTATSGFSLSWPQILLALYFGGLTLMLIQLGIGVYFCRRLLRSGHPVNNPALSAALKRLADAAGLKAAPELLTSRAVKVPLLLGLWRPRILLPESWSTWEEEKIDSVLAHEIAHLQRGDIRTHFLSLINRAIYWFHPVAWLMPRRLSLLAEQACDDLAIRWTRRRRSYARHLLELASSLRGAPVRISFTGMAMARGPEIAQRIDAILEHRTAPESRRLHLGRLLPLGLTAATLFGVSAFSLEPAATEGDIASSIAALEASEPETRARAAVELRQIDQPVPAAVEPLVALLGDRATTQAIVDDKDEPVRHRFWKSQQTSPGREASRTLGRYGEIAVEPLVAALASDNAEVRVDATTALGLGALPQALEPLLGVTADGSSEVRRMAIWGLGQIADPAALPAIQTALEDQAPEVRRMATSAESRIQRTHNARHWRQKGTPLDRELEHLLATMDPEERAQIEAAWQPAGAPDLAEMESTAPAAEGGAPQTAGRAAEIDVFDLLAPYIAHSEHRVRRDAAFALGRLGEPRAVAPLLRAIGDEHADVRLQAASALGAYLHDPKAVEALGRTLSDDDERVRLRSAAELGKLGEPNAMELLFQGLEHKQHTIRAEAAQALGRTGSREAVPPLIVALGDDNFHVRTKVALALGTLGDPRARQALTSALEDTHPQVRGMANYSLQLLSR